MYWKLVQQKDVDEVLKLKETYMTGAEASKLLGMPHSHITNLQIQGLIQPIYLGTGTPIRLFKRSDVQRNKAEKLIESPVELRIKCELDMYTNAHLF